jgi:cell division protein FtsB
MNRSDGNASDGQVSLAASLRQIFNQLLRLLEVDDPALLLRDANSMQRSIESWRRTIEGMTSTADVQRSRELERAKLELMGQVAAGQKVNNDLKERNKELLAQIVRLNERESVHKQKVLDLQFAANGAKGETKKLDLEVRELRRRIRELEGGPPLTAAEAAPLSLQEEPAAAAESAAESVEEEPAVSLADAIKAHQNTAGASDARSAAEQAFQALWSKDEGDDEEAATAEPEPPAPEQSGAAGAALVDAFDAQADDGGAAVIAFGPAAENVARKRAERAGQLVSLDDARERRREAGIVDDQVADSEKQPRKKATRRSAKKAASKKAASKKAASKKAASKKAAPKKAAPKKAAPKKAAPKKAAPKKAAPKKAAAKKAAPKKAAPKKAGPKKAAPKKAAPKKAAPKKAAPKKAAPKKAATKKAATKKAARRPRPR